MAAAEDSPAARAAGAARAAVARAAAELIEPGMTVGLGSGRAVWRLIEEIGTRWPDTPPIRAVVASEATERHARAAAIELVELDGDVVVDLALDGADQLDRRLWLIKGGGGALLREKIVVAAARRFVVVAETAKLVARLGDGFPLPVEIARFGAPDTARRLGELLDGPVLRVGASGDPFVTDEGHFILDCPLGPEVDLARLPDALGRIPGVLEHGLFTGVTDLALLGTAEGTVRRLTPP